jgi:DNA-binding response OmpR family regulator
MASLRDMHVLIVDDNAQMRTLLRCLLRAGGLDQISEAETVQQALAALRRDRADLVLADWKMAPIDGLALTHSIRSGAGGVNPCTPILMLTAHTETSRVAAARDAGVTGFLKKPVSAQMLFDRVAAALTDSRLFVRSTDFFGPDRRHIQLADYAGPFRRMTDPQRAAPAFDMIDLEDIRLTA